MRKVEMSFHAAVRMKERLGIKSESKRQKLADAAYERGVRLKDSMGAERAYILKHTKEKNDNREMVLFADRIFVFAGITLVTVLPREEKYGRRLEATRAKRHRREEKEKKTAA